MVDEWQMDCMLYRGEVLRGQFAHWCFDWDGLPIDESCPEWPCCDFAYQQLPRKLKKWARAGFPHRKSRFMRRWHRLTQWRDVVKPLEG
jgi:hypothetical protein